MPWLELAAARLLIGLSRALGPRAASEAGGWLARRVGPLLPVSRVALGNLARVMPELDAAARGRVLRGMWENLGRTVAELPHLAAMRWEIEGAEHLAPLIERGGPAILVSGHLANWEVLPPALATLGIRMGSVYRAADNAAVDALVNRLRADAVRSPEGGARGREPAGENATRSPEGGARRREAAGEDATRSPGNGAGGREAARRKTATEGGPLPLFPKGAAGARAALRHLAGGGVLGMLADQKLNDGIPVPLLGRTAMTAPAPAGLALRFGCPLIPGRVQRLGACRFRLVVEPPIPLPEGGDRQAAVAVVTAAINDRLSAWIRERPAEWLWLHRRWPRA